MIKNKDYYAKMTYRRKLSYLTDMELEEEFKVVCNELMKEKEIKKNGKKRINSYSVQWYS